MGASRWTVKGGQRKDAHLALVTITSALGRSSIYNRLKLNDSQGRPVVNLHRLGYTRGFGHFQVPEEQFQQLKSMLDRMGHRDSSPTMGTGPNWRIRVLRSGLRELGVDGDTVLLHRIRREIFALPIADNALAILRADEGAPAFLRQRTVAEIAELARDRWVVPRSRRRPDYQNVSRKSLLDSLQLTNADSSTTHHWKQSILAL